MSEIQVATRYAKSLIDLAQEQNVLEQVREDIGTFLSVMKENATLQAVLRNPIVPQDKKLGILDGLFQGKVHALILSFFKIVVSKGRGEILYATAKEFVNEYNVRKGIFKAVITSATELSPENIRQVEEVIKNATKGEVQLETRVDPDLIGGFVLKVGDRQFDTSLANSLNKLKKEFAQKVVY